MSTFLKRCCGSCSEAGWISSSLGILSEQNGVLKVDIEKHRPHHIIQHKRQFALGDLLSLDTDKFIGHLEEILGRLAALSPETSE
ncbi:MAG: hypothetical protein ACLP5H_17120 [Desulfomonilaceae bacterium]